MSVPLPSSESHKAWEIFLDADERWEIYKLKSKERPHLLLENFDKECNKDAEEVQQQPVTDGCDIGGWRRECIMETTESLKGVLNLGASCYYFRKESQWPLMKPTSPCWDQLHSRLTKPTLRAPPTIDCVEASELVEWKPGFQTTKFAWEWERKNQPIVITNCTNAWKAMPSSSNDDGWTFANLLERFGDIAWRFSDNHGEMLSLETYNKYMRGIEGMSDDSPLAIYDALFGDDAPTDVLLGEYTVPPCFSPDIFEYAADSETRPPYRWILIGPARSGTGLHIDPLWTNAWVTVLQGLKRWMLFPKETPPEAIGLQDPQIPSVIWFRDYYDKVTADDFQWKPVEVLQHPGETVFVPNGWPHLVLNLELTVAATHNYASEFGPFLRMWKEVVLEEPDFAHDWYAGLLQHRPDLAAAIGQHHHDASNQEWASEFEL